MRSPEICWVEPDGPLGDYSRGCSAKQARDAGYSPPLLEYYVREGRVERVARGIFRSAHYPPSDHEDLVVAWLWFDRFGELGRSRS